ncbi:MAG: hypothetical protein GYA33_14425 [Thermogutta sp.]|nr:hypothetical protein [Thermogutta sp.]
MDDDWLRFDFSHHAAVTKDELERIEAEVNRRILDGAPVSIAYMPLPEARKIGAMMLFGEKYPDVVRVVSVGDYSRELCGGTHLEQIARIGLFKIVAEESVAAGTRRITAYTGFRAYEFARDTARALSEVSALLNVPPHEAAERLSATLRELRQLRKQAAHGGQTAAITVEQLRRAAEVFDGVTLIVAEVPDVGAEGMRQAIDGLRRNQKGVAVLLGTADKETGKVTLIAGLSPDLVQRGADAVAWVKAAAKEVKGGGGGRPDLAQAGGKSPDKLPDALTEAKQFIREKLGTTA